MASGLDFLGAYVRRVIDEEIDELFTQLPALVLDGPKVGCVFMGPWRWLGLVTF